MKRPADLYALSKRSYDGLPEVSYPFHDRDVLAEEPIGAGHPPLALPNVVATPHVAWLTRETIERSIVVAVENCRRLSEGHGLLHRVA